jgi:Phytochelatin synthase
MRMQKNGQNCLNVAQKRSTHARLSFLPTPGSAMRNFAGAYILLGISGTSAQAAVVPEFPEDTVPAFHETDYLLQKKNADYWTLSEFYSPQSTNCGCSAASAAMAFNALLNRVAPEAEPLSDSDLLAAVDDPEWTARTAEDGGGVTMADLERVLRLGLDRLDLDGAVSALAPDADDPQTIDSLREALARNEASPDSVMLAYYNQAVVTGDPEGGLHVSPIGAYNAEDDRVLLMDVDQEFWLPYWTSIETLFEALVTPDPREEGDLADETGGWLLISAAA